MGYNNQKGYSGEVEAAEYFSSIFGGKFHFCRIGGQEANKRTMGGDIHIVPFCRKHAFKGHLDTKECVLEPYFVEVKKQSRPDIWGAIEKAEGDMDMFGSHGVIGYFIKSPKGSVGKKPEKLIVMRPDIFKRILRELNG